MSAGTPELALCIDVNGVTDDPIGPGHTTFWDFRGAYEEEMALQTLVPLEDIAARMKVAAKVIGASGSPDAMIETSSYHRMLGEWVLKDLQQPRQTHVAAAYRLPDSPRATAELLDAVYEACTERVPFPLRPGAEEVLHKFLELHLMGRIYATLFSSARERSIRRTLGPIIDRGFPLRADVGKSERGKDPIVLPSGAELPLTARVGSRRQVEVCLCPPMLYENMKAVARTAFALPPGAVVDLQKLPPMWGVDDSARTLEFMTEIGAKGVLFCDSRITSSWEASRFANTRLNNSEGRYMVRELYQIAAVIGV